MEGLLTSTSYILYHILQLVYHLFIDNVYIGYWIIESGVPHDFDNIDTTIFETVKENIVPATCTTDGSHDEVLKCKKCGAEM